MKQKAEDEDSEEEEGYEKVWDKQNRDVPPAPPPKKRFTPEQFNMLKVLGKGSFGKVSSWVIKGKMKGS